MDLQEARECLLGRLFAYGALARSGRLAAEWVSDRNTPYIKEFTSRLISLAVKKRYLQEPAVSVILDLIEKVNYPGIQTLVISTPLLLNQIKKFNYLCYSILLINMLVHDYSNTNKYYCC